MSDEYEPFMLFDYQVPEPPGKTIWVHALRWLVCVMNHDDSSLQFVTSVMAYCLDNDGITTRQNRAAQKILDRVIRDHRAGVLDCQNNEETGYPDPSDTPSDLAHMKPKGSA